MNYRGWSFRIAASAAAAAVLLLTVACSGGKENQQQGAMAMPVHMEVAATGVLREKAQLVGTLEAQLQVDVRAQISGAVEFVGFSEGEAIEKGRVLFRIDESKLQASLREAQADWALRDSEFRRAEQLRKDQVLSAQEFDRAREALAKGPRGSGRSDCGCSGDCVAAGVSGARRWIWARW